jgi:hypothetical protein
MSVQLISRVFGERLQEFQDVVVDQFGCFEW